MVIDIIKYNKVPCQYVSMCHLTIAPLDRYLTAVARSSSSGPASQSDADAASQAVPRGDDKACGLGIATNRCFVRCRTASPGAKD